MDGEMERRVGEETSLRPPESQEPGVGLVPRAAEVGVAAAVEAAPAAGEGGTLSAVAR